MSDDPIRVYSKSIEELEKSITKVQKMQSLISEVANSLLKSPYNLMVSNVNIGFPMEVSLNNNVPNLNGNEWPTSKQIAETLAELHDKRGKARNAWHALSESDKKITNQHPAIK